MFGKLGAKWVGRGRGRSILCQNDQLGIPEAVGPISSKHSLQKPSGQIIPGPPGSNEITGVQLEITKRNYWGQMPSRGRKTWIRAFFGVAGVAGVAKLTISGVARGRLNYW